MAYGAAALELCVEHYFKDGRQERVLLNVGDPVAEMIFNNMQQLPDHGTTFKFDVKYGSKHRATAMGTGPIAFGGGNTYKKGSDARAGVHIGWSEENVDLDALVSPQQIADFVETEVFGEMIAAQAHLNQQIMTGTSDDPDVAFSQIFTLHGGDDGTAITYTALDGTARNGILYHASTATQIANSISRHGISAADANTWVNQYVDNTASSWGTPSTQINSARQLYRACAQGTRTFSGGNVTYKRPTMGVCSTIGYDNYLDWLKGSVRYLKTADDGSDTMQNVMGGALFDNNCPLYWSQSIDDALTTQFSGYNGVLWFLYGPAFRMRYTNRPGSKLVKGRLWRAKAYPADIEPTRYRQLFRCDWAGQGTCLHLPSQGCMKGWNRA